MPICQICSRKGHTAKVCRQRDEQNKKYVIEVSRNFNDGTERRKDFRPNRQRNYRASQIVGNRTNRYDARQNVVDLEDKYKNYTCYRCLETGHIQRFCKNEKHCKFKFLELYIKMAQGGEEAVVQLTTALHKLNDRIGATGIQSAIPSFDGNPRMYRERQKARPERFKCANTRGPGNGRITTG